MSDYYESSEYEPGHKTGMNKVKWIIVAVAPILALVLLGGILFAVFLPKKAKEVTFEVDPVAFLALSEKDYENSAPISLNSILGGDKKDNEAYAYIHLISYNKATKVLEHYS